MLWDNTSCLVQFNMESVYFSLFCGTKKWNMACLSRDIGFASINRSFCITIATPSGADIPLIINQVR